MDNNRHGNIKSQIPRRGSTEGAPSTIHPLTGNLDPDRRFIYGYLFPTGKEVKQEKVRFS
jgi:hypothetical protein